MTIPASEPIIHHHYDEEVPVTPLFCHLRSLGEPPARVEVGVWCPVCKFTPSPVAVRMRLEAEMGLAMTEQEVEVEDDDGP